MGSNIISSVMEEQNFNTYFVKHIDDKTYVLLYLPYRPYLPTPKGYAYINAFYPASNRLYFLSKKISDKLCEYNATVYKGHLKKLFVDTKCGTYLKSSLVAVEPFGTRVALGAVVLDRIDVAEKGNDNYTENRLCEKCNICEKSCPTKALSDGDIDTQKCLRYASDHADETEVDLALMDKSVLGCDVCQAVCLYNKNIEEIDMPDRLLNLLEIKSLIRCAEGGRKQLNELCEYIGSNYNRPGRILTLARLAEAHDKKRVS